MAVIKLINKFSLFRQIRLILTSDTSKNNSLDDAIDNNFRFSSTLSLDAPDGEIESIKKDTSNIYYIVSYKNGLTGINGALPLVYTEWLIKRERIFGDKTPKSFLNMFDHRMYCLSYLAWQKMNLTYQYGANRNNVFGNVLHSLSGVTPEVITLTGDMFASFYAQSVRSLLNLEKMLSLLYQLPVKVKPFCGKWERLASSEQCILGKCNYTLGEGVVIGNKRMVSDSHFDIIWGPVNYSIAEKILQNRQFEKTLREQISSYVGSTLTFSLKISVLPAPDDNQIKTGKLGLNLSLGSVNFINKIRYISLGQ